LTPFVLNKANDYAKSEASSATATVQVRRRDAPSNARPAAACWQEGQAKSLAEETALIATLQRRIA
jgi:hypothetical protein